MGVINSPIGTKSFEWISERIAAILQDELFQQSAIQYDDDINARVYLDRKVPMNASEFPVVNVSYLETNYTQETVINSDGVSLFNVDIYTSAKTTPDGRGDKLATVKAKRLAGTIQGIIMDRRYITLGFTPPFIGNRRVEKIIISDPTATNDGYSTVLGRVIIAVRASESTLDLYPTVLNEFSTQVFIDTSDEGYEWGANNTSGNTPTCSPARLLIDSLVDEDIDSGTTFVLIIQDTDGNVPVMTYDSSLKKITVPASSGGGVASQTFNGGAVTDQDSGTTKAISVKNSGGNNVGTKGTDTALALDITIADSEIQINTVPVDQAEAESVLNIDVIDSTASPTGSWNGTAWEIDNSTINVNGVQIASTPPASIVDINVHDSAGADVGTINGLTIEIDDVTVDNSDVSYTVDIPAEGVFVLPDVTVTINGASQGSFPSVKDLSITASNIIYIRPANSGYGTTSYLTGDEGYNETNYPAPTAPAFGIPAFLDPSNPKMLLNNNAFGHKHRFTGVNGGYYDYNTSQYKLSNGTVSDQATVFGTTAGSSSYIIDNHTGLGWKWNIQGATIFSTHITNILGLTHATFTDWFLPSRPMLWSLYATHNLGTGITPLIPFNSSGSCKTSTPSFGAETTNHNMITAFSAYTQSRADGTADGAYACRWHF